MPVTLRRRKHEPSVIIATKKIQNSPLSSPTKKPSTLKKRRPRTIAQPEGLPFELLPASYGLIQERICTSLYALVVQSILWNQTRGEMARPVLFELLTKYPSPDELSLASPEHLATMLRPIGLHNIRAARLISLAVQWLAAPPCKERRYRKLHYPYRGCGTDIKPGEVLGPKDEREGWEIAHLPGMGAYALDSYRIFYRDRLRGIEQSDHVEPEWKRVEPEDKELKPYLKWRWSEGIVDRP